jgi:hypothetical protein
MKMVLDKFLFIFAHYIKSVNVFISVAEIFDGKEVFYSGIKIFAVIEGRINFLVKVCEKFK